MRTRRISYHQKFSAELVFSSGSGEDISNRKLSFQSPRRSVAVHRCARKPRSRSARETLRRIRGSTAITAGKFSQMPVTNLMSVNLSLRATALAVAAIVFLVPMVAQAGSRPCTGAHCKPVKPVVTKIEKPTVSGLNPRRPISAK